MDRPAGITHAGGKDGGEHVGAALIGSRAFGWFGFLPWI
jgi:hypothetical protein